MTGPAEHRRIRERLLARSDELRRDIRRELEKYDAERYGDLIDRVADTGEQSVADLLVDLDLAEIDRDVVEFRDIEAALLRLAEGGYGTCVDCAEPIDPARLEAAPATARCRRCQETYESRSRRSPSRTL